MSRPAKIRPDDRDSMYQILDRLIDEKDNAGGPNTTEVAVAFVLELESLAKQHRDFAARLLRTFAIEGARRDVLIRLKSERGTVRVSWSGEIVSLPARLGIAATTPEGTVQRFYQQPLWWEMSWEQFSRKLEEMTRQRDILGGEVDALTEIQRLHDLYPESQTPGEACALAGIDPRDFQSEQSA